MKTKVQLMGKAGSYTPVEDDAGSRELVTLEVAIDTRDMLVRIADSLAQLEECCRMWIARERI